MANTHGKTMTKRLNIPANPSAAPAIGTEAPETVTVHSTRVICDGSGGALGHPRVYLEMGDEGFVDCGYCDRRFVLAAGAESH
jgi:uncharacterized Zn-finger protein